MAVLLAFSVDQVSKLTGLSHRQIRYWDNTDFFHPTYADEKRRPHGRVYSFRDVVGLRVIAQLRKERGIPFGRLRQLGKWLDENFDEPWAELRFYVVGKNVRFDDPRIGARRAGETPAQIVMDTIEMDDIRAELEREAERLRDRTPAEIGQIYQNRFVSHNYPLVAGTRIRTEAIWNFHEAGYDIEGIIRQYPRLEKEDVEAAIEHERRARQLAS